MRLAAGSAYRSGEIRAGRLEKEASFNYWEAAGVVGVMDIAVTSIAYSSSVQWETWESEPL